MTHIETSANRVTATRTTSLGTTLRLVLEPAGEERVRVLEYHRKPKRSEKFKRVKSEEGVVLPFEQLNLDKSFTELFAAEEAALEEAA